MSARAETESRSACIDFLNRAAADRRGVFYVRKGGILLGRAGYGQAIAVVFTASIFIISTLVSRTLRAREVEV